MLLNAFLFLLFVFGRCVPGIVFLWSLHPMKHDGPVCRGICQIPTVYHGCAVGCTSISLLSPLERRKCKQKKKSTPE